jgi:hypothetical protein
MLHLNLVGTVRRCLLLLICCVPQLLLAQGARVEGTRVWLPSVEDGAVLRSL